MATLVALFWLSLLARPEVSLAGNTTCASGQLDWYTSVVGETPCETYQRLRQVCNIDYQVPIMTLPVPGDLCHDQFSECCCNSIAFQLSMLCVNCQLDQTTGSATGIDAPKGTYTTYLDGCQNPHNHSLTNVVQSAVCNQDIRLDDYLYGGWDDGSWFYVWTKENAGALHVASNNDTFTRCESATQSSPVASATVSSVPSSTQSANSSATSSKTKTTPNGGTIAGIVIAILAILGLAALALWLLHRRRLQEQAGSLNPYQWSSTQPHMAAAHANDRGFAPKRLSANPEPYAVDLLFSPNAMVRQPTPAPYNVVPGRSDPYAYPDADQRYSRKYSHDDSRVQEPIDDTPDPFMPLEPLRLDTKN